MDIDGVFGEGGALAAAMPSYRARRGQMEMARAVAESLAGGRYVLEAGTGIGKTFAYLAPIIAGGMSALISTGARALQDQLVQYDIPLMARALRRPVRVAVLKGRRNYLCKLAMEDAAAAGDALVDDDNGDWRRLLDFAAATEDGDIRGAADIAADSPVWAAALSTRESCTVQACKHYESCFVYRARARARRADIVIVNHHLFLSDVRLRDEGVAAILPTRDMLLFDEAHLLPQLAPEFFGERLSTAAMLRFAADAERAAAAVCRDPGPAIAAARRLRDAARRLPAAEEQNDALRKAMTLLRDAAKTLSARAADDARMEKLAARANEMAHVAARYLNEESAKEGESAAAAAAPEDKTKDETPAEEEEEPVVRWPAATEKGVVFHLAPLSGRGVFSKLWERTKTAVFTSATISVGGRFEDFCESVGLDGAAETRRWQSPYDFANRALLYTPPHLPPPNDRAHTRAVVDAALPLIRANAGRAFVLFSSLSALARADEMLRAALAEEDFTMLRQGDMPNDELLRRFRSARRALLLGSQSFWQGVDVKGDALSLVVVDKIPFRPPDEPLLMARDAWRKKRGESPFLRNQLPAAVILMKQVAGRLIRGDDDYGVFMVGDARLYKRGYGKVIMESLPPMRRCLDAETAAEFLRRRAPRAEERAKA